MAGISRYFSRATARLRLWVVSSLELVEHDPREESYRSDERATRQ